VAFAVILFASSSPTFLRQEANLGAVMKEVIVVIEMNNFSMLSIL
jgi:hypothetical protein